MKNARWAWAGNGPPLARICNTAAYLLLSFEASCSKKADFGRNYQKPHHRHGDGYPPWVKIVHTATGLASHAECLLQAARGGYTPPAGIPFISTVATDYSSVPIRRAGRRNLPNLDAALAHCAAIPAAGLEHRGPVGRSRPAGTRHVSRRRLPDSAAGQSGISTRP